MKNLKFVLPIAGVLMIAFISFGFSKKKSHCHKELRSSANKESKVPEAHGCVFKTVFEDEAPNDELYYPIPNKVNATIEKGLEWIKTAQHSNGGWGAGSHARQNIIDPHAVQADPATTAMVAMALMRCGNTLDKGTLSEELNAALEYIQKTIETSDNNASNITNLQHTQIQSKLGVNIDVVLSAQFLTNLLDIIPQNDKRYDRIMKNLNLCTKKIQNAQNLDGSLQGAGWAGVLQSSYANNALESAKARGADVDDAKLEKSRDYQRSNFDAESGAINTEAGAGVMLYSISGSVRATAKDARRVEEKMKAAKEDGLIDENEEVSTDVLQEIGFTEDEALKANTSYKVYNTAKYRAQDKTVLQGFGNNGGEEFLSFLQTGESLIVNKDQEWKQWYDHSSKNLLAIQNNDGSWNGHHCITSPVFCTATSLLILSINNDIENLIRTGS